MHVTSYLSYSLAMTASRYTFSTTSFLVYARSLSFFFFFLMIRRPPRSTLSSSSAASDVYKRQDMDINCFTQSIPSLADRSISASSPTSRNCPSAAAPAEDEDWEDVAQLQFVSPVKLYKGGAWTSKQATMQIEGDQLVFRKKDSKIRLSLKLMNIASQVHDGTLYLRQDGEKEDIWLVSITKDAPTVIQWCTHIAKASLALAPKQAVPAAQKPAAATFVVPLPPSYTSENKVKYEPTERAGKLQQLCSLDLGALVNPGYREPEPTAIVYASVGMEQMVQAGVPVGFWEKARHVDHYTLGEAGSERLMHLSRHLIFIARSEAVMVEKIAGLIQAHDAEHNQDKLEYTVACVPSVTVLVQKVFLAKLAEEASWIDAQMVSLPLAFVPIAADVFSMELKTGLHGGARAGAKAELAATTAAGLYRLETLFEGFSRVQIKGDHAANIFTILKSHEAEQSPFPEKGSRKEGGWARLVCLDREVDHISLLCTQLSYGGIIEELFESQDAAAQAIRARQTETTKKPGVQLAFTMQDPVWAEVQDLNLDNARTRVLRRSRDVESRREQVQSQLKAMQASQASSVEALKAMVAEVNGFDKQLPICQAHNFLLQEIFARTFQDHGLDMQLVATQNIEYGLYGMNWYVENQAEVKQHIHEIMYRSKGPHDLARAVRLLCLATLTAGGLRNEDLDEFRTAILQTYGYAAIPLLQGLEAAKLLSGDISRLASWRSSDWEKIKSQFGLVGEPGNEASCSAGYLMLMPLVARLIMLALNGEWSEDSLARIPGMVSDESRENGEGGAAPEHKGGADSGQPIFLLFTGGCTRAEIAEVRKISSQIPREIVILTTGIILSLIHI
eukprot:TRINITY_DN13528_c0_g1_i1.p1 TRINITY_DN13528_c0_g1~~TRINITY_DN13528_c0_g1_i1.p1  ORF type:complete len:846 (+),score=144.40 TRINITY_DN13528_c0_g1_i1:17-2554(+)